MSATSLVVIPADLEAARELAIRRGVVVGPDLRLPGREVAWVVVSTTYGGHEYVAGVSADEQRAWTVAADSARYSATRVEAHPYL